MQIVITPSHRPNKSSKQELMGESGYTLEAKECRILPFIKNLNESKDMLADTQK